MSDEAALLAAIRANPEEDTPRLVYADWLDEQGGESNTARAELIRVQIELERHPRDDENVEMAQHRAGLELRAEEIIRPLRSAWIAPIQAAVAGVGEGFSSITLGDFVRGFPRLMFGGPNEFVKLGPKLFELGPVHGLYGGILATHTLTPANADAFLSAPGASRLRRMSLMVDPGVGERVFRTESLGGLEEFTVRGGQLDPPGSPIDCRPLTKLRSLCVAGLLSKGAADVDRLHELLPDTRLTEFDVRACPYGATELRQFAGFEQCRSLERLTLGVRSNGALADRGILRAVTSAPYWSNLRSLQIGDVGEVASGDDVANGLANAPSAPRLRRLDLSPCRLTVKGTETLASNPLLSSVTSLDLSCAHIGDNGARALAKSPYLTNLTRLELAVSSIGPKGLKSLAEAPFAGTLVRINLRDNAIRKAGVELLANSKYFPNLRWLDLQRCVRTGKLRSVLTARYGAGARFWF